MFDTTNYYARGGGVPHPPPTFLFFHPLLFSNLYCWMDSTFLRMLAVPSKTDFCKVPTLYDIPNFFKLHSKFFGKHFFVFFSITTISGLRCSICLSTWIQTSHRIFTISFSMTDSILCSYHLSHTFTPYFLHKA